MSPTAEFMSDALRDRARALVEASPAPAAALHPLLDLMLDVDGACTGEVATLIADFTGLPAAVVESIAASRFRHAGASDEVQVCTGLSCGWMGADEVRDQLAQVPGLRVVVVDCLGACSAAPVMLRGGRLHDGLTPERIDTLVAGDR